MESIVLNPKTHRPVERWHESAWQEQDFRKGCNIYRANSNGSAWRVVDGLVRLDRPDAQGNSFASLALPGDVLGIEALLHGSYGYDARALTTCRLMPWHGDTGLDAMLALLRLVEATEQRTADIVALRLGGAEERITRLLALVRKAQADAEDDQVVLPSLRDIAEITGLTVETCSRVICKLRRQGALGCRSHGTIAMLWPLQDATPVLG